MHQSYNDEKVLVLTSGGQDSTTSLCWAIKNFKEVEAISFDYNQKHSNEITIAKKITSKLNIPHKVIDIGFISQVVQSDLFQGEGEFSQVNKNGEELPSSFVPYRNMLFLTIAAGWADTIGAKHLVIGVCETDYSGYPDCRDLFIKSAQTALSLSMPLAQKGITIHTPLMWLTKADEFKMAEELGCLELIINETLTCYNGSEKTNNFGMGCGECPACQLRKAGYETYLSKK